MLAEGYKEYDTGRTYMARMGDWRNNKDEEINLDGIGGVNILVKADVHRSGKQKTTVDIHCLMLDRYQLPVLRVRESSRDRRIREDGQASWLSGCRPAELHRLGKWELDNPLIHVLTSF